MARLLAVAARAKSAQDLSPLVPVFRDLGRPRDARAIELLADLEFVGDSLRSRIEGAAKRARQRP